jgi:hypothetical protein
LSLVVMPFGGHVVWAGGDHVGSSCGSSGAGQRAGVSLSSHPRHSRRVPDPKR